MGTYVPDKEGSFFEPLGSSVPSAAAATPTANTPPKLLAQDTYWRWFQYADKGGSPGVIPGNARPAASVIVTCPACHSAGATHGARCAADGDSRITGPDAVKFFELSGLPRDVLAKVWAHADSKRQGYLDFNAFVKASCGMPRCSHVASQGTHREGSFALWKRRADRKLRWSSRVWLGHMSLRGSGPGAPGLARPC
jgi:hypothetical protein